MTYRGGISRRLQIATTSPSEIWRFQTEYAGYPKFHLCVSYENHFLMMNSPKGHWNHSGNFVLPEASVRRLPRNAGGVSVVSCSVVVRKPDNVTLTHDDAYGSLLPEEMLDIAMHIDRHELIERGKSRPWLPDLIDWARQMRSAVRPPAVRQR